METEARSPNEDNKRGHQMEVIMWSPNGDRSKVRTQMESEDGFDKLKLDHKVEKDATRTG